MGAHAVSPGGALLRRSRMFSIPKPLPEPQSTKLHIGDHKSNTMTRPYPQHQSITSPLSSREKGDWGLKRPFPLKSTMATSTPLIRIKELDTVENVTNFASAADHSLSLEKFQELHIAMAVPSSTDRRFPSSGPLSISSSASPLLSSLSSSLPSAHRGDLWPKSVFEEDTDITDQRRGKSDHRRWKFQGPWLPRMTEGDFAEYLHKRVRPKRAQFRELLRHRLAREISDARNRAAAEAGEPAPPRVKVEDITEAKFTDYLCLLRNDRAKLYSLISRFLDLAPPGLPIGFLQSMWPTTFGSGGGGGSTSDSPAAPESPYGKSGPPPSHPSAGISYLRTGSFMENHPVYGPQGKRSPALARAVYPRIGTSPVKLGVGGFVANAPGGDSEFNLRYMAKKPATSKSMLNGIMYLDTTTFGGAKAYVEAQTATVDPSGKVVLQLRETDPEAQLIAKESRGGETIYHTGATRRYVPTDADERDKWSVSHPQASMPKASISKTSRFSMDEVADEIMEETRPERAEKDIVSSSSNYGLGRGFYRP